VLQVLLTTPIVMPGITRLFAILTAFAVAAALAGCGQDTSVVATTEAPVAEQATPVSTDGIRTITIRPVGNQMRFEQTEITATAGETIRVVYDNRPATSPAMIHNVVFVTSRAEINRIGSAAMRAAAREYVPDDPAVIAATPLARPGEVVAVTFTVPDEPGDYAYACTVPGHYSMMQGTLHVVARPNT
jgi:azurin